MGLTVASAHAGDPAFEATVSPQVVKNGSLVSVRVKLPLSEKSVVPRGDFEGTEIPFYPLKGEGEYGAMLGVPFSREPGSARLEIKVGAGENLRARSLDLVVVDGSYRSEQLSVSARHVNPRRKDLIRIKRESAEIAALYGRMTTTKHWQGPFELPVKSAITSPYGTRRVFNGEMKSFHSGLDLKAAVGAMIRAPSDGVVVLAKNLFFTGNTVILDHGYGLFTIYAHLSRTQVKPGQAMKVGQLLGLAGATGRVSGPHLHWGAVIHRVKVNPTDLTRIVQ